MNKIATGKIDKGLIDLDYQLEKNIKKLMSLTNFEYDKLKSRPHGFHLNRVDFMMKKFNYPNKKNNEILENFQNHDGSVNIPEVSKFPTEATGTPLTPRARGNPRPKLTPVKTFSALGSKSLITLPNQPSVPISSG